MNTNEPGPLRQNATWSGGGLLIRAGLTVALLLVSGGVRLWQVRRVDASLAMGRESPFPIGSIPMTLGSWNGTTTELDPRIVEATGSTDHFTRRYIDQRTGVILDVIVLYGPTSDIFIHSPELCYPKAGFFMAGDRLERQVECGDVGVPFRSLVYAKSDTGRGDLQEVYYSWRYNGHWSPEVRSPKVSERIPGMYKVQVARRIASGESRTVDNPCESFLQVLIPELETRIKGDGPRTAGNKPAH